MKKLILIVFCLVLVLSVNSIAFADDTTTVAIKDLNSDLQIQSVELKNVRISSSDANGLKAILLGMIGDYETVVTDYTYSNGSYTSHSVDIQQDYAWILSCILFIVSIFCVFRIIGGIICR